MKKIIIVCVIVGLFIGGFGGVVSTLNGLVALEEDVKAEWSQVLNQYQRRTDLIPNLVETVKGYAAHEQDTLTNVVEARAKATQMTISPENLSDAKALKIFQENQNAVSSALGRLMVVVEKYPDLKANQNFMALQSQLEGTENRIAVARKDYIEKVKRFNTKIRKIPTAWIAKLFGDFEPKATFEISEEATAAPKVAF